MKIYLFPFLIILMITIFSDCNGTFTEDDTDPISVTITFNDIPATYHFASLSLSSWYPGSGYTGEWYQYSSEVAQVSNGKVTLSYTIPVSDLSILKIRPKNLCVQLYKDDDKKPEKFYAWEGFENSDYFLTGSVQTINTATSEGLYAIKVTGFLTSFYGQGDDTTNVKCILQTDGTYSAYLGYAEGSFLKLMNDQRNNGSKFNLIIHNDPYPVNRYLYWKNLYTTAGNPIFAVDSITLSAADVLMDFRNAKLTLTGTDYEDIASTGMSSITIKPSNSANAIVYNDITGFFGTFLVLAIKSDDLIKCADNGCTLDVIFDNGTELSWNIKAASIPEFMNQTLSIAESTKIAHGIPKDKRTVTIETPGTYNINDINGIMTNYPDTIPTKLLITITASSSPNWNFNMISYLNAGFIATTDNNLLATQNLDWWHNNLFDYYVVGGSGTSYENNIGGAKGSVVNLGGSIITVNSVSIEYPLSNFSASNDDIVITAANPDSLNATWAGTLTVAVSVR